MAEFLTSGQSNLTNRPHRHRTLTFQSYSPDYANVHRQLIHTSMDPPKSTYTKRYLDRFSRFCRADDCHNSDIQTDSHSSRSVTVGRICVRSTAMRPSNTNFQLSGKLFENRSTFGEIAAFFSFQCSMYVSYSLLNTSYFLIFSQCRSKRGGRGHCW